MNSKSSRSPSYLSSASYTSSPKVSSSLGSSRLYSGETDRVLNKDHFPRSSSAYQTDVGQPNSRLLGPSRDYRSPDSRSTSWKFSSTLTSSTSSRSTDRSWAGSPISSRSKLPDSDWRLGIPSVRLNATDDTDSKKAKLSYSNRGLYSRTPFTSVKESNYSSIGLGRDQSDRLTSTYAQGARPKQPPASYSSSSYSSTARDSSFNRHLPSSTSLRSPLERDYSSRISAHFLNDSSTRHSSQGQRRNPEPSSNISSHYTSRTRFYTTPQARAEATLPIRKASEDREPEGHRYSRSTIQDSSSRSCRVSANGLDNEATGRKFVHRNEGARVSRLQRDTGGSNATLGFLRNQEVLTRVQEDDQQGYSSGLAPSRMASWRDPEVDSNNDTSSEEGSSSSWLSSSRQPRNPPLLSRLRRHARDQSSHSAAGLEEEYNLSQDSWRRQDLHGKKASQEEDDDEEEGAVGVEAPGVGLPRRPEVEMLPDLDVALVEPPLHQRDRGHESTPFSVCQLSRGEDQLDGHREKPISSLVEDNLRKIKERLLLEDSDEDEDHLCRICQMGEDRASNPLIQPCSCTGSLQHVHQECLKRWLRSKVDMGRNLSDVTKCELCKEKLQLNMNDFDIQDLYRTHVQSQCDEFFNSGLYPVALFQLGDDFSDVLGALDGNVLLNLVRILREDMDNLEIPHSESDEEVQDNRPSIDFSDLDDDLDLEF